MSLTAEPLQLIRAIATLIGQRQTEPFNDDGCSFLPGLDMTYEATTLQERATNIEQNRFHLVVLGRFSTGKSTLLNALLGADLLPSYAVPTTALITELVYGEERSVVVFSPDNTQTTIDWETFREEYVLEEEEEEAIRQGHRVDRFAAIDHVQITAPLPLLQRGITVVDTPGLDENYSRTRLLLDYLPRADAIILVMDATQPLTYREQLLLRSLELFDPTHILFVVNRMDELGGSQDRQDVMERFRIKLAPFFASEENSFDNRLYAQQVHFISALDALDALLAPSLDETSLQQSGLPQLQERIEELFQQQDALPAMLRSCGVYMLEVVHRAWERIDRQFDLMEQPVQTIVTRVQHTKHRFETLEEKRGQVTETLCDISNVVKYRIYADLLRYVDTMRASWEQDGPKFISRSEIGDFNIFKATIQPEERKEFETMLLNAVESYIEYRLHLWSQNVGRVIEPALDDILNQLAMTLESFDTEMKAINALVATAPLQSSSRPSSSLKTDMQFTDIVDRVVKSSLSESLKPDNILKRVSQTITLSLTQTNWTRTVIDGAYGILITLAYTGSPATRGLAAVLSVIISGFREAMRDHRPQSSKLSQELSKHGRDVTEEMQTYVQKITIDALEPELFSKLSEQICSRREDMYQKVDEVFQQMATAVDTRLHQQIETLKEAQQHLLSHQHDSTSLIDQEKERLHALRRALDTRLNLYCEQAFQRQFSAEEIRLVAEHRGVLIDDLASPPDIQPFVSIDIPEPVATSRATPENKADSVGVKEHMRRAINEALGLQDHRTAESDSSSFAEVSQVSVRLANLIGMNNVKQRIVEFIQDQRQEQRRVQAGISKNTNKTVMHMVFTGNPGTGKTTIASCMGDIYRELGLLKSGHLVMAPARDFVSQFVGDTPQKANTLIDQALDGVLFVDEAYYLAGEEYATRASHHKEALLVLLERMEQDRDRLAVILAGYPDEIEALFNVNPGLRGRIPRSNFFLFDDYQPQELFQILQIELGKLEHRVAPEDEATLMRVIEGMYEGRDKTFSNGRAMRDFARDLRQRRNLRVERQGLPLDEPIRAEDIPATYHDFVHATGDDYEAALAELEALVGIQPVKTYIRRLVGGLRVKKRLGEPVTLESMHMVFRGNPGTGKTTVANLIGRIFCALGYLRHKDVVVVGRNDLVGLWQGHTADNVRKVIEGALDHVLFIDEVYSLISQQHGDFAQEAIDTLTALIEQYRNRLIVIVAGYPHETDLFLEMNPGLPSRFRNHINFPDYTPEELLLIMKQMLASKGKQLSSTAEGRSVAYLNALVRMSDFGNARDVRNLVQRVEEAQGERLAKELDHLDDETLRQLNTIIEADDIPDPPEPEVDRKKLVGDDGVSHRRDSMVSIIRIRENRPITLSLANLDIYPKPPAADRSR